MKTLQELYKEIIASEELKAAFTEAVKGGKTMEFLREKGCEATVEEFAEFLKSRPSGELSDAELDSVSGGGCNKDIALEAVVSSMTGGTGCVLMVIESAASGYIGRKHKGDAIICNKDP